MSGVRRLSGLVPGLLARSRSVPESFADFYERMSPQVLRFFVRETSDRQVAFDLTAATFAKAFEKRGDFRGVNDAQAAAWVWSIARNELARFHRVGKVELAALGRLALERPEPSDAEFRVVERLAALEEVRERLETALDALPADQSEVLALRYIRGLSYPEIADRLGVSNDVVRSRASRALRVLRDSRPLFEALDLLES
jgi:RNA polymerase sigma-70 factor (ECF subfamily)